MHRFPILTLAWLAPAVAASASAFPPFETRAGTQTFVPLYQFEAPAKNKLQETAERIEELGSDAIKFEMSRRVDSSYGVPLGGIGSLTQLGQTPTYREVFGRSFRTFIVWAYPFSVNSLNNHWRNGYSPSEAAAEYAELYQLALTFRNDPLLAGKTVLLGHWEGDNALRNSSGDPNYNPGTTAIDGMKAWYRNRQQAVEDARAATPSSDVGVYHYAEVNLVLQTQWDPRYITVLRNVFSDATVVVDLVSYSAWDNSTVEPAFNAEFFSWALNEIETRSNFSSAFPGSKKVFIGEHGVPRYRTDGSEWFTELQQAERSRALLQEAVSWGCPWVLYWQMYNNENPGGFQAGHWMIDTANRKQAVHAEHRAFLAKAHVLKNLHRTWLLRNPSETETRNWGRTYPSFVPSTRMNSILNSVEHRQKRSNADYAALLFVKLFNLADPASDPGYIDALSRLNAGRVSRSALLDELLNSARFTAAIDADAFAEYLFTGTLLRDAIDRESAEFLTARTRLDTETRSALWREFVDSEEFREREFDLRDADEASDPLVARKYFFEFDFPPAGETLSAY